MKPEPVVATKLEPLYSKGMVSAVASGSAERSPWHVRPKDVPDLRARLVDDWSPGGIWTGIAPELTRVSQGHQNLSPTWEHDTAAGAALWYVGGDMCDLMVTAAEQMPEVTLTFDLIPDKAGLVVFERPLFGLESNPELWGVDTVTVGGMSWGPALWETTGEPILGISVYGPGPGRVLHPMGMLIWPLGAGTDDRLDDAVWRRAREPRLPETTVASMSEDRRRLAALWLLSSQPGLATSIRKVQDRPSMRRAQRRGLDPQVRVVQLRHGPPATEGHRDGSRTYRHRWTVTGHWRNQAVGKEWSDHRPVYINPHLKGPADAPLLDTPKVKAWTR